MSNYDWIIVANWSIYFQGEMKSCRFVISRCKDIWNELGVFRGDEYDLSKSKVHLPKLYGWYDMLNEKLVYYGL